MQSLGNVGGNQRTGRCNLAGLNVILLSEMAPEALDPSKKRRSVVYRGNVRRRDDLQTLETLTDQQNRLHIRQAGMCLIDNGI